MSIIFGIFFIAVPIISALPLIVAIIILDIFLIKEKCKSFLLWGLAIGSSIGLILSVIGTVAFSMGTDFYYDGCPGVTPYLVSYIFNIIVFGFLGFILGLIAKLVAFARKSFSRH
jgi:hypothetical protein